MGWGVSTTVSFGQGDPGLPAKGSVHTQTSGNHLHKRTPTLVPQRCARWRPPADSCVDKASAVCIFIKYLNGADNASSMVIPIDPNGPIKLSTHWPRIV